MSGRPPAVEQPQAAARQQQIQPKDRDKKEQSAVPQFEFCCVLISKVFNTEQTTSKKRHTF
jgi:hypothetical protein